MSTNNQTPITGPGTSADTTPVSTSVSHSDSTATSSTTATVSVDEGAVVIRYLHDNPDFFQQHSDVLLQLDIPHAQAGGAQSLIERQVEVLRNRLASIEQRFSQMVQVAHDNDALQERVHQLVVQLAAINESASAAHGTIESELKKLFDIEHVALCFFTEDDDVVEHASVVEKMPQLLNDGSSAGNDTLPLDVLQYLFADQHDQISSYALLPVCASQGSIIGVAALGASDVERFSSDQATTFLDRIAQVLSVTSARLGLAQARHPGD